MQKWSQRKRLKGAWGAWLEGQSWDAFITVTFRESRSGHHAMSTLNTVQKIIESVTTDTHGFLGTEEHLSSTLHVHGLIKWPDRPYISKAILRTLTWQKLFDRMGRSQVVAPRSASSVSKYVSKYVTKGFTEYAVW